MPQAKLPQANAARKAAEIAVMTTYRSAFERRRAYRNANADRKEQQRLHDPLECMK